jgi:hypothetical protein
MWNRRTAIVTLTLVALAATLPALADRPARIPIRPDACGGSFHINIVNNLPSTIYYKLVGGRSKAYVHQVLGPGDSETEFATGGEKVLCVWDMEGNVIAAYVVRVDRSGTIAIDDSEEVSAGQPSDHAMPLKKVSPK